MSIFNVLSPVNTVSAKLNHGKNSREIAKMAVRVYVYNSRTQRPKYWREKLCNFQLITRNYFV